MKKIFLFVILLHHIPVRGQNIDSLKKALSNASDKTTHANIMIGIGDAFADKKQFDSAAPYYRVARIEFSNLKNDTLVMQLNYDEGQALKKTGKYAEAQERYGQAITMAARLGRVKNQVKYLYKSADLYKAQGFYYLALDRYKEGITIAHNAGIKDEEAILYNQVAWVYNILGEFELSLNNTQQYIKIYDTLKDWQGISSGYNMMAILYSKQKRYKEALKYVLLADSIITANGEHNYNVRANQAIIYKNLGEYNKSIEINNDILASQPKEPITVMSTHSNLIAPLAGKGQYAEAKKHFRICEEMNRKLLQDVYIEIENNKEIAKAELMAGHIDSALHFAHTYEQLCKEHGMLNDEYKDCYTLLADIYKAKGDMGNALRFMKEYTNIQDTLFRISRMNGVAEAETRLKLADNNRTLDVLAKENELHRVKGQRMAIFIGFGVLLVVAGAGGYRRTVRKNTQLKKQKQIIDDQLAQLSVASEIKSRFYSNVSHELRTPVTLLTGMLELMRSDMQSDGTHKQKLDVAYGNSRKLQQMIEEILNLSRLEKGSDPSLKTETVAVAPLLRRITFAFESLFYKKELALHYSADEAKDVHISIDEGKFEQIINNLVFNAVKFNKPGGSVTIKAYPSADKSKLVIDVTDTGRGMAEKDLPHIFERFYQASSSGLQAEGLGIGLSLVKEFTVLMNGKIRVTSLPGKGSTFTLEFPITTPLPAQETEEENLPLPTENWAQIEGRFTVLIVEDNTEMRYYLREILGNRVNIAEATNGKEALAWLENNSADLIISDIMMPEMDGHEFIAHVKASETLRKIPVITLTALADSENQLGMLRMGVDDYIVKPFNVDELRIRVYNLLSNYAARKEFIEQPSEPGDIEPDSVEADEFRQKITDFVLSRLKKGNVSVNDLAYELAMSERQLNRLSKALTGQPPSQLIKEVKLQKAYQLLQSGDIYKVEDLAHRVGYDKASYFSLQFYERFGKRPSEFL